MGIFIKFDDEVGEYEYVNPHKINPVFYDPLKNPHEIVVGDIICEWNEAENKCINDFVVEQIIDNKLLGRYLKNVTTTLEEFTKPFLKLAHTIPL